MYCFQVTSELQVRDRPTLFMFCFQVTSELQVRDRPTLFMHCFQVTSEKQAYVLYALLSSYVGCNSGKVSSNSKG